MKPTAEIVATLQAAPPGRLYAALAAAIARSPRNSQDTIPILENLLAGDTPISEIVERFHDADTSERLTDVHQVYRRCFTRAFTFRRQQLRRAANAANN